MTLYPIYIIIPLQIRLFICSAAKSQIMLKKLLVILSQFVLLFTLVSSVNAADVPSFPSCSNPQGILKVSYSSGTHYIVGGSGVSGSDAVYYTADNALIQCFCADNGSGIQTNWWRIADSLSQGTIDQLIKLGWFYIPSGADWGLDNVAYLATNQNYTCKYNPPNPPNPPGPPVCDSKRPNTPQILSVVRNGSKATITWGKVDLATHYTIAYGTKIGDYPYGVPNTGNVTSFTVEALDPSTTYYFILYAVNSCMPSEASGPAPKGTTVLGLASTGDSGLLYTVFGASFLLTSAGLALRKRS